MSDNVPEPDAAPAELTAAEQAVPDFDVPEPPSFDGGASAVAEPPPALLEADAVIPPAPEFGSVADAIADAAPVRTRRGSSLRAAEPASTAGPAAPPVVTRAEAPLAPAGAQPGSYRGWTVAIYGGLAVLLVGAISLMLYLGTAG